VIACLGDRFCAGKALLDCFCIAGSGALVLLCVVHFVWLLDLSLLVFSR
jgi:hypothetical protein